MLTLPGDARRDDNASDRSFIYKVGSKRQLHDSGIALGGIGDTGTYPGVIKSKVQSD